MMTSTTFTTNVSGSSKRYNSRRRVMAPSSLSILLLQLLVLSFTTRVKAEFNYEVEKRVLERIDDYMNGPRIANGISARYRQNGGLDMNARDRDAYLKFAYALMQEFRTFDMLYFGLEDGTFLGYGVGWGTYREPGNSGYDVDDTTMQHYYHACVDRETGTDQTCTMQPGDPYISCIRNCGLMKCADEETQACSAFMSSAVDDNSDLAAHCTQPHTIKWCRQYAVETAHAPNTLGFVPRTYYCHDERGTFTQQPGKALKAGFLEPLESSNIVLGDCEYENQQTKVERYEVGPYIYCGNDDNDGTAATVVCDNTFDGGYRSRDYDPRYRGWYIQTKEMQLPNWSPPYPFFSQLDLGITYSHPIYSTDSESGRHIFEGVMAVDYTFVDIGKFLMDGYMNSSTMVVVYEEAEPNYIVASSTGRKAASKVLKEDEEQPCPDSAGANSSTICKVVRDSMNKLQGYPMDGLLTRAYEEQRNRNYPRELLTVKTSKDDGGLVDTDDLLYIVQSSFYRPGGDLEWIILVISPAGRGTADAVTRDNSLFGLVCVVASLGFCLCGAMFVLFYRQRHERAVILADWRFTSAFLLGCALLNISSFTLLGENTDALCMTRMWSFHFLFALALSPLFVKVWRMWRMVGSPNQRPRIVNHTTAAMLSLPIVAFQVLILIIFSFADPPVQEEVIDIEDGIVTQRIVCSQDSIAFSVIMIIFEAGLVLIGCVLAYVTRNLDTQFGEAKQLMFSMYNIAFIGIITTVIIYTMNIDATGEIVLKSIGVFWGTVFSSAAFVLPRLMRVKEERKMNSTSIMKKSQRGSAAAGGGGGGGGTPTHRNSKVRFSMDDDKSSAISDNVAFEAGDKSTLGTMSQATDKKSNLSSRFTPPESSKAPATSQEEKKESLLLGDKMSAASREGSSMADDSFFVKGTGWSVCESTDSQTEPNTLLGRWSASGTERSDDVGLFHNVSAAGSPALPSAPPSTPEDIDNTANSTSEESNPPTAANSMSIIHEGEVAESFNKGHNRDIQFVAPDNC